MFLGLVLLVALSVVPWILAGLAFANRREIRQLRERLERLEGGGRAVLPSQATPPTTQAAPPSIQAVLEPAPGASPPPPAIPRPTQTPAYLTSRGSTRLEEQIGGIWMQNIGSVLLLLGAFFLIVWGYATGKVGAGVLVLAGVVLGIVVSWRGNVIARSLTALGNALIGVGLGVVYITLYYGHFRMQVLPEWTAFASLALVSMSTIAIGLRRREPIIATLGVLGAFLHQLLGVWVPLQGFRLPLPALLTYFAVVNGVVFVLAATVGWSGLVILSLVLTSVTWGFHARGIWDLGVQLELSALFTALGLAPVVRLARSKETIRDLDLAVVALAPLLLLLSSLPFLAAPDRVRSAALLAGLTLLYSAVSLWIDSRRGTKDLWKPVTGAATLFMAASIERGLVPEYLAMAWCAEGVVLVWLGLGRRGAWLRLLGYGVLLLTAARLLFVMFGRSWVPVGAAALLSAPALRDLLCILAFLVLSHLVGKKRDLLEPGERHLPGISVFVSNLLFSLWIACEAEQLRYFLPEGAGSANREIGWTLAATAWLLQALVLFWLAARRDASTLRPTGYAIAAFATLTLLFAHAASDPWKSSYLPILNTAALIVATGIAILIAIAEVLSRQRGRFSSSERRTPEIAAAVANLALLLWWAREAGHVASVLGPGPAAPETPRVADRTLAAVFTSAAWTLQAIVLFSLGWIRESAFLRWSGLVLFALTVLKFLLVDLDRVDAFWRFVSALGIGAALLVVSFLYQRKTRRAGGGVREGAGAP